MVATDEDACHVNLPLCLVNLPLCLVNLPLCHVNLPLCHVSRRHTRFQSHQRRGAIVVKLSTALVVELSTALVPHRAPQDGRIGISRELLCAGEIYHHQYMHSTALPAFVA